MAVAFDANTATVTTSPNGNSQNVSNMTVGSGSNRGMIVAVWFDNVGTFPTTTCTWDSGATNQSVALITGTQTGVNTTIQGSSALFGLVAPTSGNKTLAVSWTGGAATAHIAVISFTGVDQTGGATSFPHGTTVNFTTNQASPISITVTSATGNIVVATFCQAAAVWGAISGTTFANDTSGPNAGVAGNYTTGAASVTATAAYAGPSAQIASACDILASGGAAAFVPYNPWPQAAPVLAQ